MVVDNNVKRPYLKQAMDMTATNTRTQHNLFVYFYGQVSVNELNQASIEKCIYFFEHSHYLVVHKLKLLKNL